MPDYVPTYVLWNSTETATIYTFPNVTFDSSLGKNPKRFFEVEGLRGLGSIIVPGSTQAPFDIELHFRLRASNHQALMALVDALDTTIVQNTAYVLKIGRSISTTKDFNVKRIQDFNKIDNANLVRWVDISCIFRANSWA